ncbi:MAG: nuclear transport factor 2 family protein [Alphaproteobacteria bacterium]|nr:nuclear transport factor 2 family protein [Alphaproteobacteria bacterium]
MAKNAAAAAAETAVRNAIYRACLLLDDEKFADWLTLCAADFSYRIKTYSPEIRKEMTWFEQDRPGLGKIIEMLPRHNTDHGRLTRHASVYEVTLDPAGSAASAITSFACYRTMLDGINSHIDAGETQLFLIGKYHDRFRLDAGAALFTDRTVFLDTRRLDKGSHYPI